VGVAAVVLVLITVLAGTLVLADLAPGAGAGRLVGTHVGAALGGALLLCAGAFAGSAALEWVSAGALVAAGAAGLAVYRRTRGIAGVSNAALLAHGTAAGLTVAFTVLAALRV